MGAGGKLARDRLFHFCALLLSLIVLNFINSCLVSCSNGFVRLVSLCGVGTAGGGLF